MRKWPGQALPLLDLTEVPVPVTIADESAAGSLLLTQGTGLIIFVSWRNTSSANNVEFHLRDGTDATGQVIMAMGSTGGTGGNATPGWPGIPFRNGLYLESITGTPHITVTYIPFLEPIP